MTSIKIVVGAAVVAFLAMNIVAASAIAGGVSAFDRVDDFSERFTDDDRQTQQAGYRDDDFDDDSFDDDGFDDGGFDGDGFDGGDFDGGDFDDDDFGAQARNFSEGPPAPGFFEGEGNGARSGEGASEMSYAVQNANTDFEEAEDIALGEVSGRIVGTNLEGENGFPHYEVEVLDNGGQLHEVLVGAREGDIMGQRIEDSDDAYEMGYLLEETNINRREAEGIATDAYPGRVVENKLGDENGLAVWEIETFDEDGFLHEVEVNAQNGEILAYGTNDG